MKAVIVDDEPRSIEMLEWLLSSYCPEVEVVARFQSAQTALEEIPKHQFDVLFCDIAMPVLNGFELLQSLELRPFSVVFVTAHNGPVQRALRKNGIDFLLKPVDDEELVLTLRKIDTHRPMLSLEQIAGMRNILP